MYEFVIALDAVSVETCGCHIECFRYPFERILLRTTPTEFITAQGRFTDSFDSIRQFSLRHVPTHPYSSNALSQKPLLTIAFSHFHISCHSLSGLSKSSICKQMLFRSASLLSAASASMISENDETSFSKTRFASSGSNTFTP